MNKDVSGLDFCLDFNTLTLPTLCFLDNMFAQSNAGLQKKEQSTAARRADLLARLTEALLPFEKNNVNARDDFPPNAILIGSQTGAEELRKGGIHRTEEGNMEQPLPPEDCKITDMDPDKPVDCEVGRWGAFGDCSKTCNGVRTRTRAILVAPQFGGRQCPPQFIIEKCNEFCDGTDGLNNGFGSHQFVSHRVRRNRLAARQPEDDLECKDMTDDHNAPDIQRKKQKPQSNGAAEWYSDNSQAGRVCRNRQAAGQQPDDEQLQQPYTGVGWRENHNPIESGMTPMTMVMDLEV
jgi:hypothetical protein